MMTWQSGPDAKCLYFSDAWLRFTGGKLEEELGDGWIRNVHPEDVARCRRAYLKQPELRTPFEVRYRLKRFDNVYRTVEDHAVPLFAREHFIGYFGACVEIEPVVSAPDRRSVELTANVAHDLRQPLSTLMLLVDRMRRAMRAGQMPSPVELTQVRSQIDRCTCLVEDLADSSIVELGRPLALHLDAVDLPQLVRGVVETFNLREESRRDGPCHRFALAPSPTLSLERGDARRLERVFVNLVENARKFSPEGAVIRVAVRREEDSVEVDVADSGVGMNEATLAQLTERYFRGASTAAVPGMGIGLSIAREIVCAHGGDLRFSSAPGQGTTVTVRLPLKTSSAPQAG